MDVSLQCYSWWWSLWGGATIWERLAVEMEEVLLTGHGVLLVGLSGGLEGEAEQAFWQMTGPVWVRLGWHP